MLSRHRSDDTTTYIVDARYRHRVNGLDYSGERVAIDSGSDNIGDFQPQLGRQIQQLYRNQKPVPVYYNPSDPSVAVLNPEIRWCVIGFNAIFIILFVGSDLALIMFGLRGKHVVDTPEAGSALNLNVHFHEAHPCASPLRGS